MTGPAEYEITLNFTDERGQSTPRAVRPGSYLLGRNPDCDIAFPEEDLEVSRRHARLVVAPELTTIEDLGSTSGVMVNGRIVPSADIEDGDILRIGNWTIGVTLPDLHQPAHGQVLVTESRPRGRKADAEALRAQLGELQTATEAVMEQMGRRIVGQRRTLRLVWASLLAKGHCLLVGVPGLAKTYMVTSFAEVLGLQAARIQFTPDLMPMDIIGSHVMQETEDNRRRFEFVQGPIFTQLLLADEINRTPPKTQSALLEAMQERQVTVSNKTYTLPSPFCVIATQNPIEQEGTYPLPEAQLDRFLLGIDLGYPEREEEIEVLRRTTHGDDAQVDTVLSYDRILRFQDTVNDIALGEEAARHVADLVRATRPGAANAEQDVNDLVDWGAGPRGGQAILRTAKALAAMDGRPGIARDDIAEAAVPALKHRIGFNYRSRMGGRSKEGLLEHLLETTPWP